MVSKNKNKVIILSSPHCGGPSIVQLFKDQGYIFEDPKVFPPYPLNHLSLKEILRVYQIPLEELEEYAIYQVVRDPYKKFVSGYIAEFDRTKLPFKKYVSHMVLNFPKLALDEEKYAKALYGEDRIKNYGLEGIRDHRQQCSFNDLYYTSPQFVIVELDNLQNPEYFKWKFDGYLLPTKKIPHINKNFNRRIKNSFALIEEFSKSQITGMYYHDFKFFNFPLDVSHYNRHI